MAIHHDDFGADVELAPANRNKRVPVVLVLDTSGSMAGAGIQALNDGLKTLQEEFDPETGDPTALRSVELAMVSFGDHGVQLVDLRSGKQAPSANDAFVEAIDYRAPVLNAGGATPMGAAMTLAMNVLDERKQFYRSEGIPYFRPWIFLISDGSPTDSWQGPADSARQAMENKRMLVFPIGVHGADLNTLGKFSSNPALPLQGLKFRELFRFISNSATSASQSAPGTDAIAISPQDLAAWAQIPLGDD